MEKTKVVIVHDLEAEDPVQCNGCMIDFEKLTDRHLFPWRFTSACCVSRRYLRESKESSTGHGFAAR